MLLHMFDSYFRIMNFINLSRNYYFFIGRKVRKGIKTGKKSKKNQREKLIIRIICKLSYHHI